MAEQEKKKGPSLWEAITTPQPKLVIKSEKTVENTQAEREAAKQKMDPQKKY